MGLIAQGAQADELLYAYEAGVPPYDESSGWLHFDPCESPPCTEVTRNGAFGLEFTLPPPGDVVNYHLWIVQSPNPPPPTLWVEWHYRSNHPLGPNFFGCDGRFYIAYSDVHEEVNCYGNAAISFGGDDIVLGLELAQFHTFRFESPDGTNFTIAVNGTVFIQGIAVSGTGGHYIQFGSLAGTCDEWDDLPFVYNEWDMIRYGTISDGEHIVSANPPAGFLNQNVYNGVDQFTVTFDSPAYAYIDDISVAATCETGPPCPELPQVIATKRLDNGPPNVLQIVLDRPLPLGERTTFTFDDGQIINTVSYTYQLGDINADGQWNLADFAALQNCFNQLTHISACAAFDFDANLLVSLPDYADFHELSD